MDDINREQRNGIRRLSRSLLLGTALACGIVPVWPMPALAQGASEQVHSFALPSQPLRSAVAGFAQAAGVDIAADGAIPASVTAPAVSGSMTVGEALDRLLAGTGYSYRFTGARSVILMSPASAAGAAGTAAADGAIRLDMVTIQAGGTTEGTGSYAGSQASSATGLALTMRETPQAVSVVTDQRIKDQGFRSTSQALNYSTGMRSTTSETDRDTTRARGFWVSNFTVDGVNMPAYEGWHSGVSMHSSAAFYDRVEVLRGASGLLNGSGEPGASVSMTRKRATATTPEGSLELRYGSWNRIGGTVDLGTPLNADATVRGRFIMDASSGDSFVDRYHVNRQAYYGAIDADLTPSTRLSFSLEHRNHDPKGSVWSGLPAFFTNGERTNFRRGFSSAPEWAYWSSRQTSATARVQHDFDNGWQAEGTFSATLRGNNSSLVQLSGDLDQDSGLGLNAYPFQSREKTKLLSFDAKAHGPLELLGRTHEVNFGVSVERDWMKRDWPGYTGSAAPVGSIYDWDGNYPKPDWNRATHPDWDKNISKSSVFASARLSITDPLTVLLGGRYTDWKSDFQTDDRQFREFTPFIGTVYDLNDEWSLYASYTEIFNPQSVRDRNGDYLDPVVGKSYEIGAKAELFDGGMNATLAIFDTEEDNVAVRDGDHVVPGTGDNAYRGAKGIRSQGVELELSGEIRKGWNLFFGASALRLRDAQGERHAPSEPTRSIKLFTSYELAGAWEGLTIGGGLRWQDKTWSDVTTGGNSYRATQSGYAVVDAMVRYDISDTWSAQLNIDNLFDKTYFNDTWSGIGYGDPRNATLTLVSRF